MTGTLRRRRSRPVARRRPTPPPARRAPTRVTTLVHPELLRTIAAAAAAAGKLETGGPLIGTAQSSWDADGGPPSLIVSLLGTVPPGPAVLADTGSVSLGRRPDGERAASAVRWWRAVTGLDLRHLGDWHKHDASFPEPSAGDRATASEMQSEAATQVWLSAIAVGQRSEKREECAEGNHAWLERATADSDHVRFYRAVAGVGLAPMPVRVEPDALPVLPPLPWHVADPARFAAECRLLADAGFTVAIEPDGLRARPGLSLRLRRDGDPSVAVSTGPRHPATPPLLHDQDGRPLKTTVRWSATRFLIDVVREAG